MSEPYDKALLALARKAALGEAIVCHQGVYAAVTGRAIPEIEAEFSGSGYGAFKTAVADAVVDALRPVQEAYKKLEADPAEVDRQLAMGARKARAIAAPVLERARSAVGLLPPLD